MRAGGRAVGWRGWGHTLDFRTAHFRPNLGPCQSSTPPYSWRAQTFGDPRLLLSLPHPRTSRCPSCPLSLLSRGGLITSRGGARVATPTFGFLPFFSARGGKAGNAFCEQEQHYEFLSAVYQITKVATTARSSPTARSARSKRDRLGLPVPITRSKRDQLGLPVPITDATGTAR